MRPLADDEIPAGPDGASKRPWLLRSRLLVLVFGAPSLLALLARVEQQTAARLVLPLRGLLAFGLALYLWHLVEHSLLGRASPPRLRWLLDAPSRHAGLRLHGGLVIGGWLLTWATAERFGPLPAGFATLIAFTLAAPWISLSLVQSGGARRPGFGEALAVQSDLGGPGVASSLLLALALTTLPLALVTGLASLPAWWALTAAVLLAGRLAGRAMETRSAFLGIRTDADAAFEEAEAAFRRRLDRLFQRLHFCRETGDVAQAVGLLEAFLAEDDHVEDQRMLHELERWRWPRLRLEHARNVAGRLLAARRERAAWALVMEQAPTRSAFLPASLDDLARLAESAAGPGERRAVLAMVRRVDRASGPSGDDVRFARVWLAAAEAALAEGEASPARVWLGRAETRFPRQLEEAGRRARRDALRRALAPRSDAQSSRGEVPSK